MKTRKVFVIAVLLLSAIGPIAPLYSEEAAPSKNNPPASIHKNGQGMGIAATVNNNTHITIKQVQKRAELISPGIFYHRQISDEKIQELMAQALDQLVVEELAYQEAKKTGVSVSEKEINKRLNEIKEKYPSEEAFNKLLEASSLDLNSYKKLIEKEITVEKIDKKLFGTPIKLSGKEVRDYYEKNREKFREPEKIRLSQILIKVPPYGAKEEWEKGKKKADDIVVQIKQGKDFAKLAKMHSDDPNKEKGGDMGLIHKGRLEPYIEDLAFSMKVGEVSDVIQTIYGYHIIKVVEKKPAVSNPFSKVKEKLKKDLEEVAMREKRQNWIKELKEKADIKYHAPSDKKE